MEQGRTGNGEWGGGNFTLTELSIVIAATQVDPSILNPDFLRYNEIVDSRWQVQDPRISTPAFSQVTYSDGLVVTADPERVIFVQSTVGLKPEEIACPQIARRYVELVPHIYKAVGINPKGLRRSYAEGTFRVADALVDQGAWLSFNDAAPDVQLKAVYRFGSRTITVDITETRAHAGSSGESSDLLFQANIHRDITESNPQKRIHDLLSIIDSWRKDLSDFRTITAKFSPRS